MSKEKRQVPTGKTQKTPDTPPRRVVLVGTYKGDQLAKWRGWYNYPLSDKDENKPEDFAKINELWLFQGTSGQKTYKAEFVGIKTREELIRDYGYPAQGKPHGDKYLLFKTEFLYRHKLTPPEEADAVIVRTRDFAKRSPTIAKQLKAYLESPDRTDPDLAKLLPTIITKLPPEILRVCDVMGQLSFWDVPEMMFSVTATRGVVKRKTHGEAKPFVKWAGGKGQLLEKLDALLPSDFSSRADMVYVEPFAGGGAMLFHILSKYSNIKRAVINDVNSDLATCYRVVKECPEELIAVLDAMQHEYIAKDGEVARREMYLSNRERYNLRGADTIERAALFIFLNKTAFNGLYRVNSKGHFNVPFNKAKNPCICDAETIRADSELLQNVEILSGDFTSAAVGIEGSAFFYFDPPYRPLTETSAFTAYSENGFNDNEQRRLAAFCRRLDEQGLQWLLSNSDPHNTNPNDMFFEELYAGFDIIRVSANRAINSNGSGRGKINELAIRSYKE